MADLQTFAHREYLPLSVGKYLFVARFLAHRENIFQHFRQLFESLFVGGFLAKLVGLDA
jgi:hypothetical protein